MFDGIPIFSRLLKPPDNPVRHGLNTMVDRVPFD